MQAEYVTLGLFQTVEHLIEVIQAVAHAGFVVMIPPAALFGALPAVAVEIHIRCVHHPVEHHMVAVLIHQPSAFGMQGRQGLYTLCHSRRASQESYDER